MWTQPGYEAVARLIGRRAGLAFSNRADSAELGMRRAMGRARVSDLAAYLELLQDRDDALSDLIDELTVGETYFFREPAQFNMIRRLMLPEIRGRCAPHHQVRAWSTGCASGEEVFSLAILFEQEGCPARVLGSDISRKALAKARQGHYGPWSLRGAAATEALPYLLPDGKSYRLDERIQSRVSFEYLNLAHDAYPSFASGIWGMDLILCRNVLIYFDPETVERVARRLFDSLAEGGWLVTASSDPPLNGLASFSTVMTEEGVFYRRLGESVRSQESGVRGLEPMVASESWVVSDRQAESNRENDTVVEAVAMEAEGGGQISRSDPLEEARAAHAQGDYAQVVRLTRNLTDDVPAAVLHVRSLANCATADAERACAAAVARHPLAPELHYIHAVLLLDLGRLEEAARAAQRVIYLDRALAAAHFTLAAILRRRGDRDGARRAYRNARDLCCGRPADECVLLTDGETCGRLAEAADTQLNLLEQESAS